MPFEPGSVASGAAGPASAGVTLKTVPKRDGDGAVAFELFQAPGPARAQVHVHAPGAGQPVVTLQREGERVTGIRVECACGQVIELACSY